MLDWNDYFDNDREAGGVDPEPLAERLDDAIMRLHSGGLTPEEIAEQLSTTSEYATLVISWDSL